VTNPPGTCGHHSRYRRVHAGRGEGSASHFSTLTPWWQRNNIRLAKVLHKVNSKLMLKFTSVDAFVDFQILAASKHFSTSRIRTRKRLFTRVNSYVVDQFVLRFERLLTSIAVSPVACVVCLFRTTHVINGQVRDEFHHRRESLTTFREHFCRWLLLLLAVVAMWLSITIETHLKLHSPNRFRWINSLITVYALNFSLTSNKNVSYIHVREIQLYTVSISDSVPCSSAIRSNYHIYYYILLLKASKLSEILWLDLI
jgi:hypothetical protein